MDLHDSKAYSRRAFIARGLTLASGAVTIPYFLQKSGVVLAQSHTGLSSQTGVPQDRILVVVQLAGGNDGLNTVVPFRVDEYHRARPGIGIPKDRVIELARGADVGLHPAMTALKEMYDQGMLTVIQGVGYPNPNRSHFKSMDIWHTADTDAIGDGWLGRYFDNQCAGAPDADHDCSGHRGIAIGRSAPPAMQGRRYKPIAFETPDLFRWTGLDLHPSMRPPYEDILATEIDPSIEAQNPNAAFLMRTALDAQLASERIRRAVESEPLVPYPRSNLARQLAMVASMIRAGLETRVYYVSMGGFDTHAGQGGASGAHARLLQRLSEAVRAFYQDLSRQENAARVLTMTFSEFGRRVGQNASGGTDHGAAAPMLMFGPAARAGIHGRHPSLTDLDAGDLRFRTDFRRVYATVLDEWLGADSRAVLGGSFKPVKILSA